MNNKKGGAFMTMLKAYHSFLLFFRRRHPPQRVERVGGG